ncbi:MAG: hypothetical protein ACTSRE_16150 [Promethearchaeota archaeon]
MGLFSFPTFTRANSPSNMVLTYEASTATLNVTITHNVADESSHFIESVTIKVNDSIVETQTYTSQPTTSTFLYQYTNINATTGDVITVIAVCNISGQIEKSLTIGTPEEKIPGFTLIGIISVVTAFLSFLIARKKIIRRN